MSVQVTLEQQSRAVIAAGSKSFAAASMLFDPPTRAASHMLYAWCRHCDDVVDGQDLGEGMTPLTVEDRRARVADLEVRTRAAFSDEPQTDPVFRALQRVAFLSGLDARWPLEHLAGFAMDVEPRTYVTLDDTLLYSFRVAGVVGVMMAQVMGVRPSLVETLRRAQDLGLAFQLTNIARDVAEDARNGRVYLPADWLAEAGLAADPSALLDPANAQAVSAVSVRLVKAAEPFYDSAAQGLAALNFRSAWAVAAARGVYRGIGRRVVSAGPAALQARTRVGGGAKAALIARALVKAAASRAVMRPKPRPETLWTAI